MTWDVFVYVFLLLVVRKISLLHSMCFELCPSGRWVYPFNRWNLCVDIFGLLGKSRCHLASAAYHMATREERIAWICWRASIPRRLYPLFKLMIRISSQKERVVASHRRALCQSCARHSTPEFDIRVFLKLSFDGLWLEREGRIRNGLKLTWKKERSYLGRCFYYGGGDWFLRKGRSISFAFSTLISLSAVSREFLIIVTAEIPRILSFHRSQMRNEHNVVSLDEKGFPLLVKIVAWRCRRLNSVTDNYSLEEVSCVSRRTLSYYSASS